jgi:hypothetical protein|tara:strand:- start:569 stop:1000 length:432 start_codon:yes stop_codon:yes gene_type:complete
MSAYISGISNDRIDDVWDTVKLFIEMGNSKSKQEMGIDDIYEKLINRDMQLWIIQDEYAEILAALTTEIMIYPKKKTCRIVTLGGTELDEWVEGLLQVIETWAIDNGCEAMETACRKGFIKKIKKYGYEHTYTILGKELTTLH